VAAKNRAKMPVSESTIVKTRPAVVSGWTSANPTVVSVRTAM
jgi:hypothetical protein